MSNIQYIFLMFAFLSIVFSLAINLFKNPIYSVLSLIVSILFSIFLMFTLHIEFLSYIFIIVYVGAVALLFIFVVMMLNLKVESTSNNLSVDDNFVFFLIIFKFCFVLFNFFKVLSFKNISKFDCSKYFFIYNQNNNTYLNYIYSNDIFIFKDLYTGFWLHFILIGFILLVALVGGLAITSSYLGFFVNQNDLGIYFIKLEGLTKDYFVVHKVNSLIEIPIAMSYTFVFVIALIGFLGILFNRKSLLLLLVFAELLFFALSLHFIIISIYFVIPEGQIYSLFITSLAACESIIGLSFLILTFKLKKSLKAGQISLFRG